MKSISKISIAILLSPMYISHLCAAEKLGLEEKTIQCNQLLKQHKSQQALDLANAIIGENQSSHGAYECKGRAELALSKFTEATETFGHVFDLSKTPMDKMMAHALLGNAYKENNQPLDALKSYQLALQLSKETHNQGLERVSHELIASALIVAKEYDGAMEEYQEALKLAQNDRERAEIFERLAVCYELQKNLSSAIEYQVKASISHTRYSDIDKQVNAQLELGRLYVLAKSYEQARIAIEKVLNLAKGNSEYWEAKSYIYLGILHHALHDDKQAEEFLVKADKLNQHLNDQELKELILTVLSKP